MDRFLNIVGALNDETRVKLLKFLSIHGEKCVCELESSFDMIQSRLSRHLKILKDCGLLTLRRDGRWANYSIAKDLDKFSQSALEEINSLDIELPKLRRECAK